MNLKVRKIFVIFIFGYSILYTPIALIGFLFFGFSIFNIHDAYQYCQDGEPSCRYKIELFLYILCLFYIFYRLMKWFIISAIRELRRTDDKCDSP